MTVRADGRREDHVPPPLVANVVLQQDAERAVVPEAVGCHRRFRWRGRRTPGVCRARRFVPSRRLQTLDSPLKCDPDRIVQRTMQSVMSHALRLAASRIDQTWFAVPHATLTRVAIAENMKAATARIGLRGFRCVVVGGCGTKELRRLTWPPHPWYRRRCGAR